MAKAVFIASAHSRYDDSAERYHFPNSYLSRVAQTVGDWVVLYEGRAGGNRGYYGVERIERIIPDPADSTHSYALYERADSLSFENFVPRLQPSGLPYEKRLPASGGLNASAVRMITDAEFDQILDTAYAVQPSAFSLPRDGTGFAELQIPFVGPSFLETDRRHILTSRPLRASSFSRQVKRAYNARCAMSGLELRNGGGRPEVDAAHIIPVEHRGSDSIRNGLALSGTLHWMFDRGLVSVDDDLSILVARGSVAEDTSRRLLTEDRRLIIPRDPALRPSLSNLKWHRDNVFKG